VDYRAAYIAKQGTRQYAERELQVARQALQAERERVRVLVEALQPFAAYAKEVSQYHPSWQESYADKYPKVKYMEYRAIHKALHPEEAQDPGGEE
jgi:hypothetical protein